MKTCQDKQAGPFSKLHRKARVYDTLVLLYPLVSLSDLDVYVTYIFSTTTCYLLVVSKYYYAPWLSV
jgi:hypothetical protein